MSERFFLGGPPREGRAVLDGDEARHLTRVLRARIGDEVVLFDGSGTAWPARIAGIHRDRVDLETTATLADPPRCGPAVTLAVALPKGERQKWLVEKLTELGVERLVPLVTVRGVAEATASARARLERGVIEACKQCGRNRLMEIGEPQSISAVLAARPVNGRAIIADPDGPPLDAHGITAGTSIAAGTTSLLALIGPEGGFTPEELAVATGEGAVRAALGPHILRVETAAIALAARLASAS
jgi:16S rRNA (uracil1498-N3)-methyltransferase